MWEKMVQHIHTLIADGHDPKQFTGVCLLRELQDAGLIQHYLNAETGIHPIAFPKSDRGSELLKEKINCLRCEIDKQRAAGQHDATLPGIPGENCSRDPFAIPALPTPRTNNKGQHTSRNVMQR